MIILAFLMWSPFDFAKAVFMAVVAIGLASRIEDWAILGIRCVWRWLTK